MQAYPFQYFRLSVANSDSIVISNDNYLIIGKQVGDKNEKWFLREKEPEVFQIVSYGTGKLLTAVDSKIILEENSNTPNQLWTFKEYDTDFERNYLMYSILSYEDSSLCLAFNDGDGFSLEFYHGERFQHFKIHLDGLQGFAANCRTRKGEKAGTIGGLLGSVVYVTTADDLEKQLNSVEPKTIVICANIDMQKKSNTRIRSNKTIVGSFRYHTIFDSHFRTNDAYGTANDNPSDNIIFQNIDFQARNVKNRILINIWSSRNIWIDHCNFNSSLTYNRNGDGQDEPGKFIWLNTPYENYLDKKDILRSPDYITISYCKFSNRYWAVTYGTQNTEINRNRTTLLFNWWNGNVRRCPQLGNGTAHIFNNYYEAYGEKDNGPFTSGIIGGDGSEIISQNNMFNGYTKDQALMMGSDTINPCRDDSSYFSASLNGTPIEIGFTPKKKSRFNPKENYGYTLISAYDNRGIDTKAFCTKYCGCFNSQLSIKYITDSEFKRWEKTTYQSPCLIDFSLKNGGNPNDFEIAKFKDGQCFKIKNAKSRLYMQVEGGKEKDETNVQQWSTTNDSVNDIWKVYNDERGYFHLISCIGDGSIYALDVKRNNVHITKYVRDMSQSFLIMKNKNRSYIIKSNNTEGKLAIDVDKASTESGANIQLSTINGNLSQNWFFEPFDDPGCPLDTNYNYELENVASGMVMEIPTGKMESDINIEQWFSNNDKWQQWKLQRFNNTNYYYIHSAKNQDFAIKINLINNGGKVCLERYSKGNVVLLFKFSKNLDGTYYIFPKIYEGKYLVEVANGAAKLGDKVQLGECIDKRCQKWYLKRYALDPKLKMSNPIIKTQVFKDKDCVHTVVFMK
jgi:pectin lyase